MNVPYWIFPLLFHGASTPWVETLCSRMPMWAQAGTLAGTIWELTTEQRLMIRKTAQSLSQGDNEQRNIASMLLAWGSGEVKASSEEAAGDVVMNAIPKVAHEWVANALEWRSEQYPDLVQTHDIDLMGGAKARVWTVLISLVHSYTHYLRIEQGEDCEFYIVNSSDGSTEMLAAAVRHDSDWDGDTRPLMSQHADELGELLSGLDPEFDPDYDLAPNHAPEDDDDQPEGEL